MSRVRALFGPRIASTLMAAALIGLLVQASAVIASAGNVRLIPQSLLPLQGYGGGEIIVLPPPPAGPVPLAEPGNVQVTVTNTQTAPVGATGAPPLQTTAPSGVTATVAAPTGSLPAGSTLTVSSISNTQALLAQAPPPPQTAIVASFQITATTSSGAAITELGAPVNVSFSVPASAVPAGASSGTTELAFWNGSDWVVTPATITQNADGSFSIVASVTHFTLFAVLKQPAQPFAGALPPAGTYGIMVWRGLNGTSVAKAAALLPSPPAAIYVLDVARQRFLSYIPGAPAGVSDVFTLTDDQAIIVKAAGTAPARPVTTAAAAPAAPAPATPAPAAVAVPAAVRTVTVLAGDSMVAIGERTGVPWQQIAQANNVAGPAYLIQPGQVLTLPGSTPTAPAAAAPSAARRSVTVVSGDTLSAIAARTGINIDRIVSLNSLASPDRLSIGQVLFLD